MGHQQVTVSQQGVQVGSWARCTYELHLLSGPMQVLPCLMHQQEGGGEEGVCRHSPWLVMHRLQHPVMHIAHSMHGLSRSSFCQPQHLSTHGGGLPCIKLQQAGYQNLLPQSNSRSSKMVAVQHGPPCLRVLEGLCVQVMRRGLGYHHSSHHCQTRS
jgi:hypothetical protein